MAIRNKLKRGFTLVELMIVVAIIGVLAVLAIFGVRKYLSNAKTAEARNALGKMGKEASRVYEGEHLSSSAVLPVGGVTDAVHSLCQTASKTVPDSPSKVQGKKYQSAASDWAPSADVSSHIGFPCLGYEMSAPQYYMYSYTATGTDSGDVSAEAFGDLNGDGTVTSHFALYGSTDGKGRLLLAPQIFSENEDE